jgi:cobalt/nickel transport system permease protein
MTQKQKKIVVAVATASLLLGVIPNVNAMHIMEGYLTPTYCILWGVLCIPFLLTGFFSIKNKLAEHRRTMILLAISGAFIFVISSLKIPSVTGSCSHMTGTGLGAILFGASAVSVLGIIVLIFQAVLLAHGGLTTLGANTFSMAIAGPFLTYGIYTVCKKLNVNKKVSVFISTALGDLFTYCVTSLQLAIAYPSEDGGVGASVVKFLGIFAVTQLPLAIIEGLLSVVIVSALEVYAKDELADLGYNLSGKVVKPIKKSVIACVIAVLLIAFVPFFTLKGADFGGSDDAGSELVAELNGDDYEPWAEPILEKFIGGELPGEIESLLFCLQTGIGTSIIAFSLGRLVERKRESKE